MTKVLILPHQRGAAKSMSRKSPQSPPGTEEGLGTPPLPSPPTDSQPFASQTRSSLDPALTQRPFSPLTLDELGLHPPATPSALLDIITPVNLAVHRDSVSTVQTSKEPLSRSLSNAVFESEASEYCRDKTHKQGTSPVNTQQPTADLNQSASTALATESQELFLTSFLQSLTEDGMMSESQSSMLAVTSSHASDTAAVPSVDSIKPQLGVTSFNGYSVQTEPMSKPVVPSVHLTKPPSLSKNTPAGNEESNLASETIAPHFPNKTQTTDFHRFFLAPATTIGGTAQVQTSSSLSSSVKHSSLTADVRLGINGSVAEHGSFSNKLQTQNTHKSWTSAASVGSGECFLTSTPLEDSKISTTAYDGVQTGNPAHLTPIRVGSAKFNPDWSPGLSNLGRFSLPQAPPLQPEHRYPISILETDANYETDLDTDRESDISPSGTNSFCVTPTSAVQVSATRKRKSLDPSQCDDHSSLSSKAHNTSPSFDWQIRPGDSASDRRNAFSLEGSKSPLKIVPLSNIVRSRSWSNASQSSTSTQGVTPWVVRSVKEVGPERHEHSLPSREESSPSSIDVAQPSTNQVDAKASPKPAAGPFTKPAARNENRGASYDFTRQALLELIRRTNLGMTNNTFSGRTADLPSDKNSSTSKENDFATGTASGSVSAPPVSSSSSVPADLQARLQSWQHHRKRQKLLSEPSNGTSRDRAAPQTSTSRTGSSDTSLPSSKTLLNELKVGENSWSDKVGSAEEQQQKMRRHEHYQRLLLQLNAQMQMKMRMDLQKQKEKETLDATQHQSVVNPRETPNKRPEFRKPSPPSKTIAANKSDSDGFNISNQRRDGPKALESVAVLVQKASQSGRSRHRKPQSNVSSMSVAKIEPPTVKSNERAARAMSVTNDILTSGSNIVLASPLSSTWPTNDDTTSSGLNSTPTSSSWLPESRTSYAPWGTIFANHATGYAATSSSGDLRAGQPAFCQPSWYSSFTGKPDDSVTSQATTTTDWTARSNIGVSDTSNSLSAVDLLMKHSNWRRDMNTGVTQYGSNFKMPHYTTSFSTSTAAVNARMTMGTSQGGADHAFQSSSVGAAAEQKKLFSIGAEVVFWAIKGEHSVKLVGKVESVSTVAWFASCLQIDMFPVYSNADQLKNSYKRSAHG